MSLRQQHNDRLPADDSERIRIGDAIAKAILQSSNQFSLCILFRDRVEDYACRMSKPAFLPLPLHYIVNCKHMCF